MDRGLFQLQKILLIEMKHMRTILFDLLPEDFVHKKLAQVSLHSALIEP